MAFYELSKAERVKVVDKIGHEIQVEFENGSTVRIIRLFSDDDTYIRKAAYQSVGKIYRQNKYLQSKILDVLFTFMSNNNEKVRQTTINAVGEIGKSDFERVTTFFDKALFDEHHSVRNAVIGSLKKMIKNNPKPILIWAEGYIENDDAEIRREICHGIELRGRQSPGDILPLLKKLQFEEKARVRNTLIHVLGQISYKKDCLRTVISELNNWDNNKVVKDAIVEIIDVHKRYEKFAYLSQKQAIEYIENNLAN